MWVGEGVGGRGVGGGGERGGEWGRRGGGTKSWNEELGKEAV